MPRLEEMKTARPHALASWLRRGAAILTVLTFALALPSPTRTCAAATVEKHRKVVFRVAPEYPDVARKIKLGGTVRLAVEVGPNGKVVSTRILGGHPVLAKFAVDAVQQWKFEASPQLTEEIVQINFQPE